MINLNNNILFNKVILFDLINRVILILIIYLINSIILMITHSITKKIQKT